MTMCAPKFIQINCNEFYNISEIKYFGLRYDCIFDIKINDICYEYFADNPYLLDILKILKEASPNADFSIFDNFIRNSNQELAEKFMKEGD